MNDFYKSIQNIDSSEQDGLKNINKILEILNDWLGHFSTEKSLQIMFIFSFSAVPNLQKKY